MVPKGSVGSDHIPQLELTRGGPFCNKVQQKVSPLLFQSGQGQSIPMRCCPSPLGKGFDICLPPFQLIQKIVRKQHQGKDDSHFPGLDVSTMVYGSPETVRQSLYESSSVSRPTVSARGQDLSLSLFTWQYGRSDLDSALEQSCSLCRIC